MTDASGAAASLAVGSAVVGLLVVGLCDTPSRSRCRRAQHAQVRSSLALARRRARSPCSRPWTRSIRHLSAAARERVVGVSW